MNHSRTDVPYYFQDTFRDPSKSTLMKFLWSLLLWGISLLPLSIWIIATSDNFDIGIIQGLLLFITFISGFFLLTFTLVLLLLYQQVYALTLDEQGIHIHYKSIKVRLDCFIPLENLKEIVHEVGIHQHLVVYFYTGEDRVVLSSCLPTHLAALKLFAKAYHIPVIDGHNTKSLKSSIHYARSMSLQTTSPLATHSSQSLTLKKPIPLLETISLLFVIVWLITTLCTSFQDITSLYKMWWQLLILLLAIVSLFYLNTPSKLILGPKNITAYKKSHLIFNIPYERIAQLDLDLPYTSSRTAPPTYLIIRTNNGRGDEKFIDLRYWYRRNGKLIVQTILQHNAHVMVTASLKKYLERPFPY